MRRVLPAILATIGGLAMLLSFHTTAGTQSRVVASRPSPTHPPATAPPRKTAPSTPSSTTGTTATTQPATPSGFDGPVVENRWGQVQVRITVADGRLVDVEALRLPDHAFRSQEISSVAGPDLRREALQAQSASIDTISGATYTSESYQISLQRALDEAGI